MLFYKLPTFIYKAQNLKPRRPLAASAVGTAESGRPQEKAAWPSGPCVPAAPSPMIIIVKSVRLSEGRWHNPRQPPRPRAWHTYLFPKHKRAWRSDWMSKINRPSGGARKQVIQSALPFAQVWPEHSRAGFRDNTNPAQCSVPKNRARS